MKPSDSYLYPYILAKRAKLSPAQRAKSKVSGRKTVWLYPYTEEVRFRRLVKEYLKVFVTEPMLEAAKKGYAEALRNDSGTVVHTDSLADIAGFITRIGLAAFPDSTFLAKIAGSIARQSKKQWNKFVKQATGVDLTLFETDGEREFVAEWSQTNVDRLKKYANDHAKKVNGIIADGVAKNKGYFSVKNQILRANTRLTVAQANYIARDATGNLSSGLQQVLSNDAGIEAYTWNTRRDRKVRGTPGGLYSKTKYSHYKMHGVVKRWSDGKISKDGGKKWRRVRGREEPQHVGRANNCRCTGEPFFVTLVKAADKQVVKEEKESKSLLELLGTRGPNSGFSDYLDW